LDPTSFSTETDMSNFQTLCKTGDIPEGSARMFVLGDLQIGVFRSGGNFFALENRCPHAGASLAHGIIDGETVSCRIHHWQFSLRDGTRLDEACPNTNARCFPVRIIGHDLQVDLDGMPDSPQPPG
jgi:nitrite reductase (NADH) small subunit/3-phenylpropionate/trans-cinnamate dioxygenase ferredoxin subunit